jgi:hypothetical protein
MGFFRPDYRVFPDRAYARELLRPWKLGTLAIGMAWLIYGALNYRIGDWDIGVSLVMGLLTYALAPWSVHVIGSALRYRPRSWWMHLLPALAAAVLVVDTSYVAYHTLAGNPIYREANFQASLPLYFLAGAGWLYRGSIGDFFGELRGALGKNV